MVDLIQFVYKIMTNLISGLVFVIDTFQWNKFLRNKVTELGEVDTIP